VIDSMRVAAERLRDAYAGGPVAPLRDLLRADDASGAYRVQAINTAFWVAQGRRRVGHKIGLTSKVVQAQLGVGQPDFGVLFEDMRVPNGGVLQPAALCQPKVEGEIAMVFGADLGDRSPTREAVVAAIAGAAPAIEVVDSRIQEWKITFADTVADNGSAAFFVCADSLQPLEDLDLWSCGMVLEVNDEVASVGAGASCLGHPLDAVTWLARTLADRGEQIRAGDVVLSGALGPMVMLQPGDVVRCTVGGLGSVGFRYMRVEG
jgi:2-keto-4-pentenoate hydratase